MVALFPKSKTVLEYGPGRCYGPGRMYGRGQDNGRGRKYGPDREYGPGREYGLRSGVCMVQAESMALVGGMAQVSSMVYGPGREHGSGQ